MVVRKTIVPQFHMFSMAKRTNLTKEIRCIYIISQQIDGFRKQNKNPLKDDL